ncbi:MAG: hypothetical protein IJ866_03340 [Alphaproteobacteria bacterium]|nr:hypothetical protein [Alphaproteobacteria bacterium]
MKLPILLVGFMMMAMPAFADDAAPTQKLAERKTCAEIKTEIETLSAIVDPDDEIAAQLKQLQTMHRSNCVAKSAGRRTVMRNLPLVKQAPVTTVATSDALSEYLANKKSNCEKLNSEIAKLAATDDATKADTLASMRGVYDMDCVEKQAPVAANDNAKNEISEEEWAAQYDANLAAGLCGDGTKPNKYGCCTDEIFKDLGNLKFACCPKTGGDCFPPINK